MEKCLLIFLLIGFFQKGLTQSEGIITANELTQPATIRTFDLAERKVIHQHFYNDEWLDAKIFKAASSKGFEAKIKYDILNQQVLFLFEELAMVASSRKISSFIIPQLKKKFIGLAPKNWGRGIVFFESILEGKYTLLLFHDGTKQKADYHPVLNTGSKSERIVEKETFCLLDNGKVFKIPSKKKAAIKFFDNYGKATEYIKAHKINFKKKEDLMKLFEFINEYEITKK